MSALRFMALPTADARAYQRGEIDANGQVREWQVSDGDGVPGRHCLAEVAAGEPRTGNQHGESLHEFQPRTSAG